MGLQDRDYMREEERGRGSPQAQKAAHVDRMLQQLDLSNLPPSPPRGVWRRWVGWIRRVLGLGPRGR